MDVVSMHKAKTTLSQLVQRAAGGETILIGAYGKVDAKLVAADAPAAKQKRIGLLKGQLVVPDDFDQPLPADVLAAFEGR